MYHDRNVVISRTMHWILNQFKYWKKNDREITLQNDNQKKWPQLTMIVTDWHRDAGSRFKLKVESGMSCFYLIFILSVISLCFYLQLDSLLFNSDLLWEWKYFCIVRNQRKKIIRSFFSFLIWHGVYKYLLSFEAYFRFLPIFGTLR